jgi:hypothetical protein
VTTCGGTLFWDGTSATAPAVDADAPPAIKDTPAIPNTGAALLRRFPFETRFTFGMAKSSLIFEQMSDERTLSSSTIHSICIHAEASTPMRAPETVPGLSWVVEQPCGVRYLGPQTMPDDLRTNLCQG